MAEAKELMDSYGQEEYQLMIRECSHLIESGEQHILTGEEIPKNLQMLSPVYVRYSEYNCEINLYKVPGRGIGYFVKKTKEGGYGISWHNYFESWDSHAIDVPK